MQLSPKIIDLLNMQIAAEQFNEVKYRVIQCNFADQNLDGLAAYFDKQATDEYGHKSRIIEYMVDKNAHFTMQTVPSFTLPSTNVLDIATFYYDNEVGGTKKLYAIADAALKEGDHGTLQWLYTFLIPEQVEEEDSALTLIERVKRTCNGTDAQLNALGLQQLDTIYADLMEA